MKTLLLGGFEPFGLYAENPSWEVARALHERFRERPPQAGWRTEATRLPVDFAAAPGALQDVLERERPDAVLLLGLAGPSPFLDLETVALNVGRPEVREAPRAVPFDLGEGGGEARRTTVDLPPLVAALRDAGVPARQSFHAGTFLCNAAYYHLLGWAREGAPRPALFVHLPLLPDQAARHYDRTGTALPSLSLDVVCPALTHVATHMLGGA